ncbi:MAG: hypothetical protein V7709_19200, partial [Halioglobus sp.]
RYHQHRWHKRVDNTVAVGDQLITRVVHCELRAVPAGNCGICMYSFANSNNFSKLSCQYRVDGATGQLEKRT